MHRPPTLRLVAFCALAAAAAAQNPLVPTSPAGLPLKDRNGAALTYGAEQLDVPSRHPVFAAPAGIDGPTGAATADWTWFALGTGIGLAGLEVSTANGQIEIITGCGGVSFGVNSFWAILAHNAATGDYEQQFVSPVYDNNSGPVAIRLADVDPAVGPEIVIGRRNGDIDIWNQGTRTLLATIQTGNFSATSLAIADVDGDGNQDLLLTTQSQTAAYSLQGQLQWTVPVGGRDLTTGQMDADPALEIAVTSGHVIDGATRQIQWTWNQGFGIDVESADIDGDGLDELVAGEDWAWVWAYDIDTQLPKWSIAVSDIDAIELADIDGDGTIELIVGEGQWGDQVAFDTVTQQEEWRVDNPEHGTTSIASGDVDGDGNVELIWGAGWTSSGEDHLYVADWTSNIREWESLDLTSPFLGPHFGDLDGDGIQEMVAASADSNAGFRGGVVLVFDANQRNLLDTNPAGNQTFRDTTGLRLVDLDGDGDLEIVTSSSEIVAWDYSRIGGFTQLWVINVGGFSNSVPTFEIADIDGDAVPELILGTSQFVEVWDIASQQRTWNSFFLNGSADSIEIHDIDGDGVLEIVAVSSGGNAYAFDGVSLTAEVIFQPVAGRKFTTATGIAGGALLILGDDAGQVTAQVRAGSGYTGFGPIPVAAAELESFMTIATTSWFMVAADGVLQIHDGLPVAWCSADYGMGFGKTLSLHPAQPMVFTASRNGVMGFAPVF